MLFIRFSLRSVAFVLSVLLLSSCGGGGSSTGDSNVSNFPKLSDVPIAFGDMPSQNQEVTLSLFANEDLGEVQWRVTSQPPSSNLTLTRSLDTKEITFTASEPGDYELLAISVENGSEKSTNFIISPTFSFDQSKIEGNDGIVDIDIIVGAITNQSWIYSNTLTRSEIETITSLYPVLQVLGYDQLLGLLVEYDENNNESIQALDNIRAINGIDSVRNRYFRGDDSIDLYEFYPNDGAPWFPSAGENWHLSDIGLPSAWEITTGSDEILVGISESGFDIDHTELKGRLGNFYIGYQSAEDPYPDNVSHGNASAGAIGALTGNGSGMSAVNLVSKLFLGWNNLEGLRQMSAPDDIKALNMSWGWKIPESFSPNNVIESPLRKHFSRRNLADYRSLANANPDKLYVWAGGNGIGNGSGNNGIYGVDAIYDNGAIHYNDSGDYEPVSNILVVAAYGIDSIGDRYLVFYSNYGESISIAAPTSYKSLSDNNQYKTGNNYGDGLSGYTGTSAAAPVVTGTASLIYSIYPGFTGAEVKDILINSSTSTITDRQTNPSGFNATLSNFGAPPIPILNAAAAVQVAQQTLDGLVNVQATPNDASVTLELNYVPEAIGYNIYWATESGVSTNNYLGVYNYSFNFSAESYQVTIPDLINETTYYFTVSVITSSGESSGTTEVVTTPLPNDYTLTLNKTDETNGNVTSNPGGISCGTGCSTDSAMFDRMSSVTLTAVAPIDYTFNGWTGCDLQTATTCTVTMDSNRNVTASFVPVVQPTYTLILNKSDETNGTVTSSPGGISCDSGCSSDSADFDSSTLVTLTATAANDYAFDGWIGCDTETTTTCTITMNSNRIVSASFIPIIQTGYTLTINKSGASHGTVIGSDADGTGINCGDNCSTEFLSGSTVALTAIAASGYEFDSWQGCTSIIDSTCSVTMDSNKTVFAIFTTVNQTSYTLTLNKPDETNGTVTSNPVGISCISGCSTDSASFDSSTVVTLTAVAANDYSFDGWTGCDTETATTCTVSMNGNRTVSASFTSIVVVGPFDGDYGVSALSTTATGINGYVCTNALGVMNIVNSQLSGYVIDGYQDTYQISGNVDVNGDVTGGFASGSLNTATFEGAFSGDNASGTWVDIAQCEGTWTALKN